jgi:hypothetical protein
VALPVVGELAERFEGQLGEDLSTHS